jgi:hypothetical protein
MAELYFATKCTLKMGRHHHGNLVSLKSKPGAGGAPGMMENM